MATIKRHIKTLRNLAKTDSLLGLELDLYNPNKEMGYVYLIQLGDTDCYKIGSSIKPEQRIKQIQAKCPIPLRFIYKWWGHDYKYFEKMLHYAYRKQVIRGEWFKLSTKNICWIIETYPVTYHLHESDFGEN